MPYENKNLSNELEQFVTSIRLRALEDTSYQCCTDSQARRLAVQVKKALNDPNNRIPVLRAITGLPIHSQNELTFYMHSILIDETKEPEDAVLLREIENLVEATPDREPASLLPWYRPVP